MLTLVTTLIGFVNLGVFTMVIAIAIAALKASLIATFFMHALYENKFSAGRDRRRRDVVSDHGDPDAR